jgi:PAS domain S-box-containing protein
MRSDLYQKAMRIRSNVRCEPIVRRIQRVYLAILAVFGVSVVLEIASDTDLAAHTTHYIVIVVLMLITVVFGRTLTKVYEQLAERQAALESTLAAQRVVQAEFERFFEMSMDILVVAGFDGYFKRTSPALTRILGFSTAEIQAVPFLQFVHPEDIPATGEAIKRLTSGEEMPRFENRFQCKDGSYRWISWSSRAFDGMTYAIGRDITDRKLSEEMLRISEEKYRTLFENTGLFTLIYDREGTILMANQQAAETLNVASVDQLIGRSVRDVIDADNAEKYIARVRTILDSGESVTTEDVVARSGGGNWHFLTIMHPIPDMDGKPVAVQVIAHDISPLKEAEQQEFALTLATEKAGFLAEFLGTFSHDLKTPLTVMSTSLYLLERATDPTRQREKIAQIQTQMQRIDKLIQDTLYVSRLEHLPELQREPVNVQNLLTGLLAQLRPRAEKKRLQMRYSLGASASVVQADADQLTRAFLNLLENAINYTPEDGSVALRTRTDDGCLIVEIADTGVGIAPDDLPHIFDRFYRARGSRDMEASGTGLGLAIVKQVMDKHQFSITVESTVGLGTTFCVYLPLS